MSKFGFHPMRTSKVLNMPDAKKITITTIVHIPELIEFWKLSIKKYLMYHMVNKIPNISIELPWYNKSNLKIITTSSANSQINKRKKGFILNSTRLRKLVKALHLWIYKFLYERK